MHAPATPPFFIVGAQRSGTTLLRLMLNRHPDVSVPFESGFIPVFYRKLAQYGDLARPENARRLLDDIAAFPLQRDRGKLIKDRDAVLAHPIASYGDLVHAIFSVDAHARHKTFWGDKTPGYVTDLDVLWSIFPGCRIVHLVRDGRDVVLSNQSVDWGIRNLPRAAADWRWKTILGHKVGGVLGDHYLELRYEDLVRESEAVLRRVCRFLELTFDPGMLEYHRDAEAEMPEGSLRWHRNSVRAPDPTLVHAWKRRMSPADRIIFEQVAGDALELFGYEREGRAPTLASRARNLYYAVWQRW